MARIAPATPWTFDRALNTTCVGPDYEVGEDKIGIPIPGLTYRRKGDQSHASTSAPTSPIKLEEKNHIVGTIPAVPTQPFVIPPLQEHEQGIDLVQNLPPEHVAMTIRVLVSLVGDESEKMREIAKFSRVTLAALKAWLGKYENKTNSKRSKNGIEIKSENSDTDELLSCLRMWLRHESASHVNTRQDARREEATKAKKKLDKNMIFPEQNLDMAASYGLVNVPSNLTNVTTTSEQALSGGQGIDDSPSSAGTTVVGNDPVRDEHEELGGDKDMDVREKTGYECTTAFGIDGELKHFEQGCTEETMAIHTEILLDKAFRLKESTSQTPSGPKQGCSGGSQPCAVCVRLKTLSSKCGTSEGSVNCLKKSGESKDLQLPGAPSRANRVQGGPSAKDELQRIEDAWRSNPTLLACAPKDEVEAEILALQYELLWQLQSNRQKLKRAQEKIASGIESDNDEQAKRKAKLDEAATYMSGIREVKRQQKKEKREADQLAALERAKAAVGDGRRESKPKREMGSAAIVGPDPKSLIPTYKPPTTQAVMKAIEAAPSRVKKMFGLANFDPTTSSHLKSFSLSGTPRSGSPVLGASPIRSPMSSILLDPFHAVSDNKACCVCAGTEEAEKMEETMKCSQCELIVHPHCYGITGDAYVKDPKWLCFVCNAAVLAGTAIPKTSKKSRITLQGKLALYRGVECTLCPVKMGAFKKTLTGNQWCHVACAKWVPEAHLFDRIMNHVAVIRPVNIEDVPRERRNASCTYCTRSHGTLMRCCFGHCQTVFHPLCCRRAACHMRAVDHSKKRFTAFCEKHSRSEREKDLAVNLMGDPVPALVEMYNQSPLERQLSGGLQRTLSGGTTGVSPMNGAMRRIRETMRAKDTQKRAAFGGLPSSAKAKTKKTRSNLQQANRLPGSVPGSSLAGFDSEENFDDLLPGQRGQARNTGALRGGALPRDALLTSPEADKVNRDLPTGYQYMEKSDIAR